MSESIYVDEKPVDIPVNFLWIGRNNDGTVDIEFIDDNGKTKPREKNLPPKRAIEYVSRFLGIIQ